MCDVLILFFFFKQKTACEMRISDWSSDVCASDLELVAWRPVKGSDIDTEGRVALRDAPGGRGTLVEAIISFKPPAGALGRAMATMFQKEPAMQARRGLQLFKHLEETGLFANPANPRETHRTENRREDSPASLA